MAKRLTKDDVSMMIYCARMARQIDHYTAISLESVLHSRDAGNGAQCALNTLRRIISRNCADWFKV